MGLLKNSDKIRRPHNWKDLTGMVVEKITVLKFSHVHNTKSMWLCRCSCGREWFLSSVCITSGRNKSCGCKKRIGKHKLSRTAEYHIWLNMLYRCHNEKHTQYKNYGGRGILVCNQWQPPSITGFVQFLKDVGNRPFNHYTLDRIDNNGSYCPENCHWATRVYQTFNTRKRSNNTSGRTGVFRMGKKWMSKIHTNNRSVYLGTFTLKEDAIKARELAEIKQYGHIHKYQ